MFSFGTRCERSDFNRESANCDAGYTRIAWEAEAMAVMMDLHHVLIAKNCMACLLATNCNRRRKTGVKSGKKPKYFFPLR
jgi:hypothetical protein